MYKRQELRQHGVQLRGLGVDATGQQQLAARRQIILQLADFNHGEQTLTDSLTDALDAQNIDAQRIGYGVGQGLLAVVGGIVGVALPRCGELIDGRGCLLYTSIPYTQKRWGRFPVFFRI